MESLKDFTFTLAERVSALELLVQGQAREIAFLTGEHGAQTRRTDTAHGNTAHGPAKPPRLMPQMQQRSTVSMHGSSAASRSTTVEVEETGTESTTDVESV